MKLNNSVSRTFRHVIFGIVLALVLNLSTDVQAKTLPTAGTSPSDQKAALAEKDSQRFISIDFNNVDINVFIKFISELTSRNFVVDQRVRGKVTIISPSRISVKEAYKVFESVLEVHGFTAVKAGDITKIIPSPDARSKDIETRLKEEAASPEDKIVTQLVPLKYASADEIKRLFAPLVSKSSVILSYSPTNMLIITDVFSNIQRLLKILNAIDVAGMGQELSVIPLEHADAAKFIKILDSIFQENRKSRTNTSFSVAKFVADERTNTLIVMASEVETSRIRRLINMLDRETPRGKGKIHVYYLENAKAEDLGKVLQELPTKKGAAAGPSSKGSFVSENVKITADKATNSLIIIADKEDYQVMENIIKKLDVPRSMVYIESLIMEVSVNKEFSLGVQWQAGGQTRLGDKDAAFGGGFIPETGIASTTSPTLPNPSGFSLGIFSEAVTIGGITFPNLYAIVNAFKKDQDVHILSTPQILTTDNEEASITVGKSVPFQTRAAATSENLVDQYSYYEYKDVGITLKITPQISHDRMVRLNISQESTKLDQQTTVSSDRPTTLKRTIDTTVIVKDGNTVVIGGLIDDSFSDTEFKTPCLGDIPLLGRLFRTTSTGDDKTNLFVFITPHVVKNPDEARAILDSKKEQVQQITGGKINMYENAITIPGREPKK
jgi:general secretion pathway protein D